MSHNKFLLLEQVLPPASSSCQLCPCPTSDRRLIPQRSRTPGLPCKGTCRRGVFSRQPICTPLRAHCPVHCKQDEQRPRAPRSHFRRKLTRARAREFDQKTDRESPCPSGRTALAKNQPPTLTECVRRQAISSRKCSRGM